MSKKNGSMNVAMTLDKETKGTFRLKADDPNAVITTLYIEREAMKDAPTELTVSLKEDEKGELKFDRETKGTYIFQNDAANAAVRTLYVQREAFEKPPAAVSLSW